MNIALRADGLKRDGHLRHHIMSTRHTHRIPRVERRPPWRDGVKRDRCIHLHGLHVRNVHSPILGFRVWQMSHGAPIGAGASLGRYVSIWYIYSLQMIDFSCAHVKTSFRSTMSVSHSAFRVGNTQWVVMSVATAKSRVRNTHSGPKRRFRHAPAAVGSTAATG